MSASLYKEVTLMFEVYNCLIVYTVLIHALSFTGIVDCQFMQSNAMILFVMITSVIVCLLLTGHLLKSIEFMACSSPAKSTLVITRHVV